MKKADFGIKFCIYHENAVKIYKKHYFFYKSISFPLSALGSLYQPMIGFNIRYMIPLTGYYSKQISKFITATGQNFSFINYKCGHRNVLSKRQVWMSIFRIINFKRKKFMDTGALGFF